jgi:REP element-mobilizing transposase RayT
MVMPTADRHDAPGVWHHVMNRGIARRPVFENRADVRHFLACLARAVRRKEIEVHAYAVLTTHFHVLVRSPRGMLSQALGRTLLDYVRWFNRVRRRDGPLFRGRFRSRVVEEGEDWANVVRYIDHNAVEARIASSGSGYPFGSASWYAQRRGPPWLQRDRVEAEVCARTGQREYDPRLYDGVFGDRLHESVEWLLQRRISLRGHVADGPELGSAPEAVREWLHRKTRLADGSASRTITSPQAILRQLDAMRTASPEWRVGLSRMPQDGWQVLAAGALREACGLSVREISLRLGVPRNTVHRRLRAHLALLERDLQYRERTLALAQGAAQCRPAGG